MLAQNIPMPAIPQPTSASSVPLLQSDYHVLKTDTSMSLLWSWGKDGNVFIEPKVLSRLPSDNDVQVIAVEGLPIPVYSVVSRTYWKNAGGWTIAPGDVHECDANYTYGVEKTTTSSWAAEVGGEGGGFEAKLSESFSQTITISENGSKGWKATINGDPKLYTNFTLWVPVLELAVLDENGAVLVTRHEDRTATLVGGGHLLDRAGIVLLSTIWTMPIDHPYESKVTFAEGD